LWGILSQVFNKRQDRRWSTVYDSLKAAKDVAWCVLVIFDLDFKDQAGQQTQ